ncbi:hypothetical protein EON63_22095 [archaeon]|nr:MAG: hypothetical protein EON63_22095 [archaeon]
MLKQTSLSIYLQRKVGIHLHQHIYTYIHTFTKNLSATVGNATHIKKYTYTYTLGTCYNI